ncbi:MULTISPECIES: DNA polymerase III subunit delta' [unclassified Isoptericola]|uniref:DNA polymerase III subunit delta' n=1 Tax=unclassified Isoptericola TaxID=2623355 RepID=UPI002712C169|nr:MULTISPECIES: DNA polymerase III subunit delta' [unclassified Isoptericola]MDO8143345.1 DNA polymerase III subunit delta' [Isoptericola sp. 178]MDO8147208.1 DNA polymerase III subunit delta' [Isoptericola sp. b515]MDO8150479.1 DNA polymerase III subunit delta' [Isoptericola sp. b408]
MTVWDDVVGQPEAVGVLRRAATDPSAMTHAWLLTGPPGSGRSVAARAFAAALQCPEGGCGRCRACTTTLAGTHPDLTVVATDKVVIAIDEVRDLITTASRTPSAGRYRVIVVEDADRMVERTTNVLLKSIEEPPAHTVWVLCAPSSQDVLPTIRSRCRSVALRVPPARDVADLLVRRDGVDPAVALQAAQAAQSHVGMARRLARDPEARQRRADVLRIARRIRGVPDAVLAAADLVEVAKAEAAAATTERDAAEKSELLRALGVAEGETVPPKLRSQVKQLEDDQKRRATRSQRDVLDRAMVDLLSLYRDVLVVQLGADVEPVNGEQADTVRGLARDSTPEQTVRRMDAIGQARERLEGNVAPLLAVEAMAIALRPQG